MPINKLSISQKEASAIVNAIVNEALADGGPPVAVAVTDAAARLISFAAMDGVMPASIRLSQSKAYSAVIGQRDTISWASFLKNESTVDFDMRNWTDENFSGFTGGVIISIDGQVIGGVGVSGRKGVRSATDTVDQDNELALFGKTVLKFN